MTRPNPPPSRDRCRHCVSCGITDYRCCTPTSFLKKMAYRNPKTGLTRGASQNKLASEAYRAIGVVARNSLANRAIMGHCTRAKPERFGSLAFAMKN